MATVEMTEKQKEKVIDILAKEKAETEKVFVDVRLLVEHRINGVPYGPGTVKVPQAIAGTLLSNDQAAIQARLKEMTSDNNMIEILGRGLSRIHKGGA
jgi:hypothetical protein